MKEKELESREMAKKEEPEKRELGGFEVKPFQAEPIPPEPEEERLAEEAKIPSEAQLAVNEALIRTACLVIGKTAVAVTKFPELAFDEEETNQLVELWKPFLPVIPPIAYAIIGTTIIVGGKVGIYFSKRKEANVPE